MLVLRYLSMCYDVIYCIYSLQIAKLFKGIPFQKNKVYVFSRNAISPPKKVVLLNIAYENWANEY